MKSKEPKKQCSECKNYKNGFCYAHVPAAWENALFHLGGGAIAPDVFGIDAESCKFCVFVGDEE